MHVNPLVKRNKNIVIAPCGNRAFLYKKSWLKYRDEKEFDLCLLFYDDQINDPSLYECADYFFHLKEFKYKMIFELLTTLKKEWQEEYEYFYFLDDDIEIDTKQINQLFFLSKAFNVLLSSAALTHDSFCSWPVFKQKQNHFCRYIGQIEVMSPLFSAAALKICLPSFIANRSSWGLDSVWAKLLGYPEDKFIVFDTVPMRHIYPVGTGELYKKIGVDPEKEWMDTITLYNAKRHNLQEFKKIYIINKKSNGLAKFYFQYNDLWIKRRNLWKSSIGSIIKKSKKTPVHP